MANSDIVNGFKPVGTLNGGKGGQGYVQRCLVDEDDSTALALGDIVKLAAGNESLGIPTVTAAAAGETPYGVVVSFENWDDGRDSSVTQTLEKPRIRSASTRGYALVAISPDLIMEVQASGTVEDGDIGAKADLTAAGADTTAQTSGMEIDASTLAATSTLVFHVLEIVNREDNALGSNAKLLVSFNIHELGKGCYEVSESDATGHAGVHA